MKLSCLPVSFFPEILAGKMSVVDWARVGKDLGLDGIDLSILFLAERTQKYVSELRQDITTEGIKVAMVTTYPDFTHPRREFRMNEVEKEAESVALAAEVGAEMVRITAGQAYPDVSTEHGIEWAVECLHKLEEKIRGTSITLVYENHAKPMVWEYTDFSQPPEIFLKIFRQTQDINLRVNFDTGNAAAFAPDSIELLDIVLPRIYSIHASDTARKGNLEHVLLGTGVTPFKQMFIQLQKSGWNGWICMEEASKLGVQGVIAAADFIRNTWLTASQV